MNNEELKKKLIKTIRQGFANADCRNPYTNVPYPYFDSQIFCIADALIAARIGDVSELKKHRIVAEYSLIPKDGNNYFLPNTPLKVKQLYSGEEVEKIVKERNEYKRRAEVAERALKSRAMCHVITCFTNETSGIESCVQEVYEAWIYQAEKELAEEKGK